MAITRVEPLLRDLDTMTHLLDPLSLYMPLSLDEGVKNDQSLYCSEEPQTKLAIVKSYCKDALPSEYSNFLSRNRFNSDISAKKKRTPFKQKKIACKITSLSLRVACEIYSKESLKDENIKPCCAETSPTLDNRLTLKVETFLLLRNKQHFS